MSLMAADVTSLIRLLADYNKDSDANNNNNDNHRDLVTRDFLGCALVGSKELDLELKVPTGWERRLDLLSGETYLEKSGSNPVHRELHDLNLPPPPPPPPPANDRSALDLKLLLPSAVPRSFDYRSVCTLDKVRSALERAGHESGGNKKNTSCASPSTSTSTSSSSIKRKSDDPEVEKGKGTEGSGLVAAGCPSCMLYVLISKRNPRCPRCDSHVPLTVPVVAKKQRIDLNSVQ